MMEKRDDVAITTQVPRHLVSAFNQSITEFFVQARGGKTPGQLAEELRNGDCDAGLDSLVHLMKVAEGDSGQCRTVARFLAGLYNGMAFPFDLTDLRGVDEDLFEHCLAVLRLDNTPKVEIHNYFPDGGARFQRMIRAWNLDDRPEAPPLPLAGSVAAYCRA